MNVNDKHFNPLAKPFVERTVVLADYGFRAKDGVPVRLSYVSAMFNVHQNLFHSIHPDADPYKMSIAEFSL